MQTLSMKLVVCTGLVVVQMLLKVLSSTSNIPIVFARGTHYEVGFTIGQSLQTYVQKAVQVHQGLNGPLQDFNKTERGRGVYERLLAASRQHFPQYIDEIQGLADGAEVDFNVLFLLHMEPDITTFLLGGEEQELVSQPGGCSDFFLLNNDYAIHVHSEDAPPEFRHLGAMWAVEITDNQGYITESFIAYAYPGMIPGNAWWVNSHGLAGSGNIVFQKECAPMGSVPRRILFRAVMASSSISHFISTLERPPVSASGFHSLLSQRICPGQQSSCVLANGVEVLGSSSAGNILHVENVTSPDFLWHFNEYRHLTKDQFPDPSSATRVIRLQEIIQELGHSPNSLEDLKLIMSDDKYQDFPFYRDGSPPDYLAVGSIAFIDQYAQHLYVFKEKPAESEPEVIFDISPWDEKAFRLQEKIISKTSGQNSSVRAGKENAAGGKEGDRDKSEL